MKQRKWWYAVLCVSSVSWVACGEEARDPLDPSSFAGMNAEKVNYDCQHTIQCNAQLGEELAADPIDTCIVDTARLLESRPELHMQYLSNVTRCQNRVVCDYKTCALTDVQGTYGQLQIEKVTYSCQQHVECRRQLGMATDITMELNSCIGSNVGYLDTFTPDQRTQYETGFTTCNGLVACEFTNCFPF